MNLFRGLAWFLGLYYFATGVWPLIHVKSFEWVTGEKSDNLPSGLEADHWLLMTVSVLIVAVSLTILTAAWRNSQAAEIAILAILAGSGLTAIDVVYVLRGIIRPIYLVDAAVEIPLILTWLFALIAQQRAASVGTGRRANEM